MLHNNWIALAITLALSILWLRANDFAAHRGWVSGDLSRKIIHMGTGPIFVLCWLLFDDAVYARFLAALIPLAITIQFALVGSGVIKDSSAVEAMSRTGERKEILRGPLYYGIVFVILTIVFWKNSPIGIVALMLLCGGDGLADVAGKRLVSLALPWSKSKSLAGSMAMFLGGLIFATVILGIYVAQGIFPGTLAGYLPGLLAIAVVGTIVESMPFKDIDNITVPIVALLLGWWLL
jgi:phytol kinase